MLSFVNIEEAVNNFFFHKYVIRERLPAVTLFYHVIMEDEAISLALNLAYTELCWVIGYVPGFYQAFVTFFSIHHDGIRIFNCYETILSIILC